jgi:hypothetical protein
LEGSSKMDLKGMGCEDMNPIPLANRGISGQVLLDRRVTVNFVRRTLLHVVTSHEKYMEAEIQSTHLKRVYTGRSTLSVPFSEIWVLLILIRLQPH